MHFSFSAGIVLGDSLFFSDNTINGLFKTDLIGHETMYIGSFQNEDHCKGLMHKQAISKDDMIYFVPNQGFNVHVFNIETFEIKNIPLYKVDELRYVFSGGVIFEDYLYIVPGVISQPVISINLKTYEQKLIDIGLASVLKNAPNDKQLFSRIDVFGDKVYMPVLSQNRVVEYNIPQNSIKMVTVSQENLANIYVIDNSILISTLYSGLYYYDVGNKEIVEIKGDEKEQTEICCYTIIKKDMCNCYAVPDLGGKVLLLKKGKDNRWCYEETSIYIERATRERVMGRLLEYGCNYNKGALVFPTDRDELMFINDDGTSTINTMIKNERELYSKGRFDSLFSCGFQREGDILELKDYIGIVSYSM